MTFATPPERAQALLLIAGLLHFLQLPLSWLLARRVVPFQRELGKLDALLRQIFIVLMIAVSLTLLCTGLIIVRFRAELSAGDGLSSALTGFLALFFGFRLLAQGVYQRSGAWPQHAEARLWHHVLAAIFSVQTALYAWVTLS